VDACKPDGQLPFYQECLKRGYEGDQKVPVCWLGDEDRDFLVAKAPARKRIVLAKRGGIEFPLYRRVPILKICLRLSTTKGSIAEGHHILDA